MAFTKSAKKGAKTSARFSAATRFTDEELAAMRERAQEMKPARRANKDDTEATVLEKFAAMASHDRAIGERLHEIVTAHAPSLTSRLWYGMPAYANSEGNIVCFFQDARKFKTRYATLGFSDKARLDDGPMWPTSYALMELGSAEEARIAALLKKALEPVSPMYLGNKGLLCAGS
ncbi:MAG: DUF1801 domain-containing protein [Terracidiphilus sp.]